MKQTFALLYAAVCYVASLGTALYAIGFMGNAFVPKAIDGEPATSLPTALLQNTALLLLFALQHSTMAKPDFKNWWKKYIPAYRERSTYLLFTSLCLILLMWQWQPINGVIWSVKNEAAKTILIAIYIIGWGVIFLSTFFINHFELFGLKQVWLYLIDEPYKEIPSARHSLYLVFLIAFWATPVMTIAHLLLTVIATIYIFSSIKLEEDSLEKPYCKEQNNFV